ncbi:SDR family oxidoreductase [Micromonospora sp. b486]|uniref:SDR family oxidoreductase n=1 Tax=Micromonospora sp. b486 TaxID=3053986 RepID=UPI00259C9874|nr:SDR family oxidoreductase [Micromonospora sp. b486]MDM4784512.1 SDR family oxidoreductase [Micromonospora sp. b486]
MALAEAGYDIGITWYGDAAGADRTATEVRASGRRCETAALDPDPAPRGGDGHRRAGRPARRPGVLVNNAAPAWPSPFVDVSWEKWREVLAVDLDGPFLCSQRAARRMRAAGRGGRIISITSVHEHAPRVGSSAYCAAKGGLGLLTKVMAQELAADGITVNAVAPGEIATPMTGQEDVDPFTPRNRPGVPVGRPGDAREVAAVVAMLASPPRRT